MVYPLNVPSSLTGEAPSMSLESIRPGIAISASFLCLERGPSSLFTSLPGIFLSV